jgi:SAM-dependent methyltransferase
MSSSSSILVVTPGCPAGLIQELLEDCALSVPAILEALLPPGTSSEYANLMDKEISCGGSKFFPSPARRFFSSAHLKWLREHLSSSANIIVLVSTSPSHDPTLIMAVILVMMAAGKTITLMRPIDKVSGATIEPGLDLDNQALTSPWIMKELHADFHSLSRELGDLIWFFYPGFVKNLLNYTERELCYYFNAYDTEPVNLRSLDSSPEVLQKDVERSLLIGDAYLDILPGGKESLKGKKVLEIGPGINFGSMLMLACHGAEVMVTDRFLAPWDPEYHPKFYRLLKNNLTERRPSIDLAPLNMVLSEGGYHPESIALHSCSLEELSGVPDQGVDIVLSYDVLEHLYDLESAFFQMARITKPGGFGLHQVDFRDHRDFSRPLEYLLLSNKDFSREFKERHGECGNRYRPQEMRRLLESVGFEVKEFRPDIFVEEEYLSEFLGRLRQARKSRYREYPAEELRSILGFFFVVKKPIARG